MSETLRAKIIRWANEETQVMSMSGLKITKGVIEQIDFKHQTVDLSSGYNVSWQNLQEVESDEQLLHKAGGLAIKVLETRLESFKKLCFLMDDYKAECGDFRCVYITYAPVLRLDEYRRSPIKHFVLSHGEDWLTVMRADLEAPPEISHYGVQDLSNYIISFKAD